MTNRYFNQCYPAKHPKPFQTRQHYLAKKPQYPSPSEDHVSATQLGSLFILNNLLITTLANATQLSHQSTFKAASATWLSNQGNFRAASITWLSNQRTQRIFRAASNTWLSNQRTFRAADATWLSNQSTFRAASATWLSNQNTHHPLEMQLGLPSLVLSPFSDQLRICKYRVPLVQNKINICRTPNIIVLICLWQL